LARITSKHPNKEPWHENIRSNGQRQGKKEDSNSSYANYRAKISLPVYFFIFLFCGRAFASSQMNVKNNHDFKPKLVFISIIFGGSTNNHNFAFSSANWQTRGHKIKK